MDSFHLFFHIIEKKNKGENMKDKLHFVIERNTNKGWIPYGIKNEGITCLENMLNQRGESKELLSAYYSCSPYIYDNFLEINNPYVKSLLFDTQNKFYEEKGYSVGHHLVPLKQRFKRLTDINIITDKIMNKIYTLRPYGFYTLKALKEYYDPKKRITIKGFMPISDYLAHMSSRNDDFYKKIVFDVPNSKIFEKNEIDELIQKNKEQLETYKNSGAYVYIKCSKYVTITEVDKIIECMDKIRGEDHKKRIIFW